LVCTATSIDNVKWGDGKKWLLNCWKNTWTTENPINYWKLFYICYDFFAD
jgi:hypothetical protein